MTSSKHITRISQRLCFSYYKLTTPHRDMGTCWVALVVETWKPSPITSTHFLLEVMDRLIL